MKVVLPEFRQAKILVVGDLMLDRYWSGPVNRISPEAPVPIVRIGEMEDRPGGAANVAMNMAALGIETHLTGVIGADDAGRILEEKLKSIDINCHFLALNSHPTITKLRILSRHQQLLRLDFEEDFHKVDGALIINNIKKNIDNMDVLVLSDYAKGTLSSVPAMIHLAKQNSIPTLVDPKGVDFERYRGATLLTPNLAEFEAIVGFCETDDQLVDKGMKLIMDLELEALLVTRSEQGMTLLQRDKTAIHMPTQAQEVFDVTGAGDTVIAVLAAALAAGSSLEEACYLSNIAAGIVVGKLGTSSVSPIELSQVIYGEPHDGFGIVSEEQLKSAVQQAHLRGERIVMTNGCFDILHAGHVSYLKNAKKQGDRLIIAVNSDDSVRRLKGQNRPINSLMERMLVLSALESVDWVVPFEEDTPQRLISNILPDVLVKGGDYRPEDIAGGKEVIAAGGEVKVLNFEQGFSTSNIINNILTKNKKEE